jgi:hypothetical protein
MTCAARYGTGTGTGIGGAVRVQPQPHCNLSAIET